MRERRRSGVPLGDGVYAILVAPGGPLANAAPPRNPRCQPRPTPSTFDPQPGPSGTQGGRQCPGPTPGPSGAPGGPRRPPPGYETVDLTADVEDEEMVDAPASPSPHVSDMETDEKADRLASPGSSDSDSDGFQHV